MAEGHGGMRRPSNPAPVSGPGALKNRTDGQGAKYIAGGEYGEGQEMMDLQTSAPMSKAPAAPRPRTGRQVVSEEMAPPTPLFAPTERPDEPITAGAPFGPGPGPTARTPMSSLAGTLEKLLPYDDDGSIRRLYATAVRRGW
jgi:hypothetical protein